jgi:hypothetical protein
MNSSPWFFETRSHSVAQAGLELMIFLPLPPEYQDYKHIPYVQFLDFSRQGMFVLLVVSSFHNPVSLS